MEAMLERSDPVNLIFGQIPRGMNPRLLGAASTWLQLAFSMAACGGENEPPEIGGQVLAFLALFMLPGLLLPGGAGRHEQAKTTRFCVSCHEIKPYWESLHIDAPRFLPAAHYQN